MQDDYFNDYYGDWLKNYNSNFSHESTDEVLIGWRVWRLFDLHYDYTPYKRIEFLHKEKRLKAHEVQSLSKKILQSTFENSLWIPGVPAEGLFNNGLNVHSHSGLYAVLSEDLCKEYLVGLSHHTTYARQRLIYGTVSIWGEVIEHERGYRAQFMYPGKLFIPEILGLTVAQDLYRSYGCEVEVVENLT